jgi:hypothetical protein
MWVLTLRNDLLTICCFCLPLDSLKMLALERVRGKFFTRAWGEFLKLPTSLLTAHGPIQILLRFYQGSWINSGSNIDPVDGISQRRFTDLGKGRILHLLGLDSNIGRSNVFRRVSEEFPKIFGKWVSWKLVECLALEAGCEGSGCLNVCWRLREEKTSFRQL